MLFTCRGARGRIGGVPLCWHRIASRTPWQPRFTANLPKSLIIQSASPYWWGFTGHTNIAIPEVVCGRRTMFTFLFFFMSACSWNNLVSCQKFHRDARKRRFVCERGYLNSSEDINKKGREWNNRIKRTITDSFSANFLKNASRAWNDQRNCSKQLHLNVFVLAPRSSFELFRNQCYTGESKQWMKHVRNSFQITKALVIIM